MKKKKLAVAGQYARAIEKISQKYFRNYIELIDIYAIEDLGVLKTIEDELDQDGDFKEFGAAENTHRAALKAYMRFIENEVGDTVDSPVSGTEKSILSKPFPEVENLRTALIKALLSQVDELFSGYTNSDKLERNEKRIDLLLESHADFLAIKIVVDAVNEKDVSKLWEYILEDRFSEKPVSGIIITNTIDESFQQRLAKQSANIKLMSYRIKLKLCND